jgi:hypothetical protein
MTDDILYEDVGLGEVTNGKEATRTFVEESFQKMAAANMTFDYVVGKTLDDNYFLEWVLQPFGMKGASIGTLRDGKITSQRDYWNAAAIPRA